LIVKFFVVARLNKRVFDCYYISQECHVFDEIISSKDPKTLVKLGTAAVYLKLLLLVDMICKELAHQTERATREEISDIFNIQNDEIHEVYDHNQKHTH
jgi:hypothetical protein